MENSDLYILKKEELFQKGKEIGYISLLSVRSLMRRFKLSKEEMHNLWDEIEKEKFDVLVAYQVKAREIENKEDRIDFCHYVFINKILNKEINIDEYDQKQIKALYPLINDFLDEVLNKNERLIIDLYYGLKNGELLENDEKILNQIPTGLDQYIDVRTSAFRKVRNPKFLNRVEIINKYNEIDEYRVTSVESGKKDCLLFAPYSKGRQFNGPAILQSTGDRRSTDIGLISSPGQLAYSFTIYTEKGDDSCLLFYNEDKKPRPEIYFCKDYISFGVYYPKLGYHGNLYTFKKGKKVNLTNYWEGTETHSKDLPLSLDNVPSLLLPFEALIKADVRLNKSNDYREFVSTPKDGQSVACRFGNFGDVYLGSYRDGEFDGVVVEMYDGDKICVKKYTEGAPDDSFRLYANVRSQYLEFLAKNEDGTFTSIFFDPSDSFHSLIVGKKDIEGKVVESTELSNPFADKEINVQQASDPDSEKSCEERLNELIGLETVKKMIKRLKAYLLKNKGSKVKPNLNMFFTGNPGTGKTEVARLLAGIFYDNGIIKENKFVEVDRSKLVGKYVGESENKTDEIIKSAMGGVLFIDEAYSLYTGWEDKDYGNQVIDKLVKAMEDNKGDICMIFAGYTADMEKLYTMNAGLASRIQRKIEFPNYTLPELKLIQDKFLRDNNYVITEDASNEVMEIMETRLNAKDFGNARDLRNILEGLYEIQAERTEEETDNRTLELCDVQVYEDEQHIIKVKKDNKSSYTIPLNDLKTISSNLNNKFVLNEQYIQEVSVNIKIQDKAFGNVLSEGSGFFINSEGLIGTCAHVIKDAPFIRVVANIFTSKGKKIKKTYNAEIVGLNEKTDVGLIKICDPGENEFTFYPLEEKNVLPLVLSSVVMGGYPLGGERFEKLSINEGKVQSINSDKRIEEEKDIDWIYVDLTGSAGNSGSGVIDKQNGRCVGIYAGASLGYSGNVQFKLNRCIPIKYLWDLIESLTNN